MDEDGTPDACDNDIDGDGVNNASDNCPLVANAGNGIFSMRCRATLQQCFTIYNIYCLDFTLMLLIWHNFLLAIPFFPPFCRSG